MTGDISEKDKRRTKWAVRFFFWLTIISMFSGAWVAFYKTYHPTLPLTEAQRQAHNPMTVTRHLISNGQHLVIPVPYFKTRIPANGETKDILLIVMYPDFTPLQETPQKLWEKGLLYETVMVLFGDPTGRKTPAEIYMSRTRSYQASTFQGIKYELRYYTQAEGVENDGGEVFVAGSNIEPNVVIACGKQVTLTSNPQCSMYIMENNLWFDIGFDKDLLPHWDDIKNKTISLTKSFKRNPAHSPASNNNKGD